MTMLGDILRAGREAAALTLRDIEDATGISNAYISQLETGKVRHPSAFLVAKLARFLALNEAECLKMAAADCSTPQRGRGKAATMKHTLKALEKRVAALEAAGELHHERLK